MSRLWTKARRDRARRREEKRFAKYTRTLEYQLTEILSAHVGERGYQEGAVDVLGRIIRERNQAMTLLALKQMNENHPI